MIKKISSQRYRHDVIIDKKIKDEDFKVSLSPEFEYYGNKYQVVMDGHHALEAAKQSGNDPIFVIATKQDDDNVAILQSGDIDRFLTTIYIDSDYYDIDTNVDIEF